MVTAKKIIKSVIMDSKVEIQKERSSDTEIRSDGRPKVQLYSQKPKNKK